MFKGASLLLLVFFNLFLQGATTSTTSCSTGPEEMSLSAAWIRCSWLSTQWRTTTRPSRRLCMKLVRLKVFFVIALASLALASINHTQLCSQRQLPQAGLPFRAEEEHPVLYPGDLCPIQSAGCTLLGFLLDLTLLCSSTDLHRYGHKNTCISYSATLSELALNHTLYGRFPLEHNTTCHKIFYSVAFLLSSHLHID